MNELLDWAFPNESAPCIHFHGKDKPLGILKVNEEGRLCFEGDVEESAKIFFDAFISHYDKRFLELREENAQLTNKLEEVDNLREKFYTI